MSRFQIGMSSPLGPITTLQWLRCNRRRLGLCGWLVPFVGAVRSESTSIGRRDRHVRPQSRSNGWSLLGTNLGGEYNDNLTAIALDDIENAYIVGYYQDNVLDWPNNHIVSAGRPYNGFVSKVNPAGTFAWSRDIQGGVNGQPVCYSRYIRERRRLCWW